MTELLINASTLRDALPASDWLVFDARHDLADHGAGRRAYAQGHIPGAIFLDHEQDLAAPRTGANGRHPLPALADFAGLMARHGLTPSRRVVVYDGGGGAFAAHVWWMLRWLGHDNVSVLDGGWPAWVAAGGQAQADAPAVQPAPAPAAVQPGMKTVDAQAVRDNIQSAAFVVLDARSPERFRGETEPMDPVAGHIPGARNYPSNANVAPDGRFKPADQLREGFLQVLGDTPPDRVVHQCGSGITACHNLFAMELAGLHGSAVYPGSWSEWCSDPSRPVATGA